MNILSVSYGNDSVAMIQWAHERGLKDVWCVYCDTGWSSPTWPARVRECEAKARDYGFRTVRVNSIGMESLVRIKKAFPRDGMQFCTTHLKGLPFLEWADEADPARTAVVLIGKRREESVKRRNTREIIGEGSEYHGDRKVWHPLCHMTEQERDELIHRLGMPILPHRSLECNPCVNANKKDLRRLTLGEIERVSALEVEIAQPMFRAKKIGALGIYGAIAWAKDGKKRGDIEEEFATCDQLWGCGT